MAQKSITSFFSVQKKKAEEPRESVTEKEEKGEKKCDVANGKPPVPTATNGKTPTKEVASPVANGKRKQVKRIVMSSDEEGNESPSSSGKEDRGSSKSSSPSSPEETVRKTARKKQVKGADALKDIETKRAARKAKLDKFALQTDVKEPDQKKAKIDKTAELDVKSDAESESKSDIESETKSDAEPEVKKEKENLEKMEEDVAVAAKSPAKSPAKAKAETKEAADITSDFSDADEKAARDSDEESPSSKPTKAAAKGKAKPKTTKKKSPVVKKTSAAASTKKTSPAASSKKTSPASSSKKTSQAISSFFAPKGKKGEEDSADDSGKGDKKSSGKDGEYNPSKTKYHPIEDATWQRCKPVPYLALARTLECIEETSSRLRITEILSHFFRSVLVLSPDNLIPSVYLCLNKFAPAFEGLELGLAERSLIKAVAQSSGRSEKQVLEEVEQTGDLGIVAQNSCGRQAKLFHPPPLSVPTVFSQLKALAAMKGRDSMSRKQDKVVSMYNACKPIEARYLLRSLTGKLRIGLAEQTVLQALALTCVTTPPVQQEFPPPIMNASHGISTEKFKARLDEQALILKTTYCECPVYEKIIPVLLEYGLEELPQRCQISTGIPLRPMLAHPTKGVAEVLSRFDGRRFTCEWKYDGERAQVHFKAGADQKVRIFSRNQEDNTSKFPEVVTRLASQLADDVDECILDCEAVAWDRDNSRILPFQILSTRKKKDATEADIKVQVCLFVFDLLYINGESLVKVPLEERRRKLKEVVKIVPGQMQFAESLDTDNVEEVHEFLDQSVKGNCEGLMVKTLAEEATYEIAKRSRNWLKLKKDYLEGVGDTLDLVVLGGYLGRGKRAGLYGGFLLACYDPDTEQYQSICKIGTGFTDESLQTHSEFFKEHVLKSGARPYYQYDSSHEPDHWFDAVQVWEVKCADLSISPAHKAAMGIVDAEKGISLRFPRFIRIRDDKKVEEATSATQVSELYQNQEQVKNQSDTKVVNEEDFY